MPGAYLYGWDAANSTWVKCLSNAEGKLIIDPTEIFENDPTDNEHGKAPDSDWAHDHGADVDAHHAKYTDAEAQGAINADADHGSTAPHNYFSGSHDDLIDVSVADHHARYTDAEAQSLIDDHAADVDAHHAKYTDAEAQGAINADADHGSTAPHNYFSEDHADLTNVTANQHHAQLHAASHKDGGGDELDVADLAGAKGTDGQIPTTDGAAVSWQDPAAGGLPSGTKMLFKQGSAPTGWTFVSEDNDRVILNTSTEADGGVTGGSWTIGLSVGNHALTEAEMPSHDHGGSVGAAGNHSHNVRCRSNYGAYTNPAGNFPGNDGTAQWNSANNDYMNGNMVSSSGDHTHSISIGNAGSDNSHGHNLSGDDGSWRPNYVTVITCQKD